MPLYEFTCPEGHDFEKFYRSIGAGQTVEKCPECGLTGARRISAAGLVFKGSGFYITDYGKDGKKAERDAATAATEKATEKATKAESAASEAKPSESAPAAKSGDSAKTDAPAKPASEPKQAKPAKKPATSSAKTE